MNPAVKATTSAMRQRFLPFISTLLCALAALPISSAATSFPSYPLQTGASRVEPNILFILDDSGSMADSVMSNQDIPTICRRSGTSCVSSTAISSETYVSNSLYYNPTAQYRTWLQHDGNRMAGGTSFNSVYGSLNFAGSGYGGESDLINLASSESCEVYDDNGGNATVCGGVQTFYVPKNPASTATNYLYNAVNYWRYQIRTIGGQSRFIRSELVQGGSVGSATAVESRTDGESGIIVNSSSEWSVNVPLLANSPLTVTMTGSGNARLRVYRPNNTVACDPQNAGSNESCSVTSTAAGTYRIVVTRQSSGGNGTVRVSYTYDVLNSDNGCTATNASTWAWSNCSFALPTGPVDVSRSEAQELSNYATWFSYHRTRMKLAKAGASEAFGQLTDNVRVGYRTIWNRSNYDIPVGVDTANNNSGVFKGTARQTWYTRLFGAQGRNGTPLRGALDSAGRYFQGVSNSGPYGPAQADGTQLACRQNFAILTTDGYWNSNWGSSSGGSIDVGDQDGTNGLAIVDPTLPVGNANRNRIRYEFSHPYRDGSTNRSSTLADVAMKYWKTDLRSDMDNIVPTRGANSAFWQHMVTFGISIGLKGSLDQASVSEIIRDGRPRINGASVDWPNPEMNNESGSAEIVARIDDLLHAAVNGRGEFVAATNADGFRTGLNSVLGQIQARLASGSNVATNSTSFQSDTRMFQATYTSGRWTGDLVARDVTAAGGISSSEAWRLTTRISQSLTDSDTTNDFPKRAVLTWNAVSNQRASFPTVEQTAALARTTGVAPVTGEVNAAYIKGDQSNEISRGKLLRNRTELVGDIVNSSPFYVKDTESIYVGANDGMLHGINALTGSPLFSYLPAGVNMASLRSLSDPDYGHAFFVDGPVTVSSQRVVTGKNYLVGALGRGGKGVFGLDVSSPATFGVSNVLWDKSAVSDNDMGYVLGAPIIVKGNNGDTLAIVSNGIDSTNGSAVLYVYNMVTGAQLKKLEVGSRGGNGLSAPRAADMDNNGTADYVYAGDLKGNVWKFDLSSDTVSEWAVSFSGTALFKAVDDSGNVQPITGGIALAREPGSRRLWLTFGTGSLIALSDVGSTTTQSIYGIIDNDTAIAARSELTTRTIAATGTDSLGRAVRAFESYQVLPAESRGWYVHLGNPTVGERVVSSPRIDGRAAWISSIIPDAGDGCSSGGTGYLNALDLFSGTSPSNGGNGSTSFFDLDGDGSGDNDVLGGNGGNGDLPVGSIDLGIGMPTESSQVDNVVLVCGSDGTCEDLDVPPGGGQPKRLLWREIFRRG